MKYTASDFKHIYNNQNNDEYFLWSHRYIIISNSVLLNRYITWNKHLYELILVGIVPRKNMQIYL